MNGGPACADEEHLDIAVGVEHEDAAQSAAGNLLVAAFPVYLVPRLQPARLAAPAACLSGEAPARAA